MKAIPFKLYYRLAKPGIVYGNVFTTIAAFLFASRWQLPLGHAVGLFFATNVGIALVIGSACVFNNYLDRDIDAKMPRTQKRTLVTGAISARSALTYGAILGLAGALVLFILVNALTAWIALFGFFMYVVVYGIAKRASYWGALVGSIPGAVPIVVGYTAVTGRFDIGALILFFILVTWQMPHFYAIAMYRVNEYKAAGIPVLPAVRGMEETKLHILFFIVLYLIAVFSLGFLHYAGHIYLALVLLIGVTWLGLAMKGFAKGDVDAVWARKLFLFSLIVLVSFCVILAVTPLFPF